MRDAVRGRKRLKKHELVGFVFNMLQDEYEQSDAPALEHVAVPVERILRQLASVSEQPRQSSRWVFTQLRRYEEEHGTRLFRKFRSRHGEEMLQLTSALVSFLQKKHLHVAEKIRVANGVLDKLHSVAEEHPAGTTLRLALGAGTTVHHLAEAMVRRPGLRCHVVTHNLGVLEVLSRAHLPGVTVEAPAGRVDPVTYALVGGENGPYSAGPFDMIVQGTTAVYEGELFIESEVELERKRTLLHGTSGTRALVLTLNEFAAERPSTMHRFGSLADYDYLVLPSSRDATRAKRRAEAALASCEGDFEPEIIGWHYRILRRRS